MVNKAKKGKDILLEHDVKSLLREKGFSVPEGFFAGKGAPIHYIKEKTSKLSYPLVVKVSSSKIVSKTDVGGIRTGLRDFEGLKRAMAELLEIEGAEGVLIEEMMPGGLEVIVGGLMDEQFGPIIMFGLGGVFVEIYRDVVFCLAPLNREDALWMISQVKAYPLLKGYRGLASVDIPALSNIIVSISEMIASGNIKEIDLNPVILYPEGYVIVDAKMRPL